MDALKRAVEKHKMVGIGGLVSVLERDPIEAHDLLCFLGEILNEAEAQAHLFGPGNYPLLRWLVTQSWCRSADSARWIHGLKSRMLLTRDGQVIRGEKLLFPRLQCAENNVRAIQEWMQPQPVEEPSPFSSPAHTVPSVQLQWLDDPHTLSLP